MGGNIEEVIDPGELSSFFSSAWPDIADSNRDEIVASRYRAHLPETARRGRHFVKRDSGSIIAHLGVLPCPMECDNLLLPAAWLFDWISLPAHRGSRAGIDVMNAALNAFPLVMAIGLTEASESIFRRSGWADAGLVDRYCLLLDPAAVANARFPRSPRIPGTSLFASAMRTASRRRIEFPFSATAQDSLPDIAEAMVRSSVEPSWIQVRRDAEYLQGRYSSSRNQTHHHIVVQKHTETVGWAAWSSMARQDGVRIARLLEFHTSRKAADVSKTLMDTFVNEAIDERAQLVEITARNFVPAEVISRFLFRKRHGHRLMWRWNDSFSPPPVSLKESNRWAISGGDSDLDR